MFDYTTISDFLSSSLKDRIVYELSSPKKSNKAWNRFSHGVDEVINTEYIYFKGNAVNEKIKSEIKNSGTMGIVLSAECQAGKTMSIDAIFDYLSEECNAALALIENWLVIKPEYEGGKAVFYILRKK